jgi:catechol 2,3-dioxygenase-like lactoylglutathione lyase family enzyme
MFAGSANASTPETEHLGEEHFGLKVKDLEATAAELKQRGVHFSVEPVEARPGVKMAYVTGPDNMRIELLQRD